CVMRTPLQKLVEPKSGHIPHIVFAVDEMGIQQEILPSRNEDWGRIFLTSLSRSVSNVAGYLPYHQLYGDTESNVVSSAIPSGRIGVDRNWNKIRGMFPAATKEEVVSIITTTAGLDESVIATNETA